MCCMYVDSNGWKCRHKSPWKLEHYIFITFVSSNCAFNHLKYLKLKHCSNEKLCELWIKIWQLSFLWETCVLLKFLYICFSSLNLNYLHIFNHSYNLQWKMFIHVIRNMAPCQCLFVRLLCITYCVQLWSHWANGKIW